MNSQNFNYGSVTTKINAPDSDNKHMGINPGDYFAATQSTQYNSMTSPLQNPQISEIVESSKSPTGAPTAMPGNLTNPVFSYQDNVDNREDTSPGTKIYKTGNLALGTSSTQKVEPSSTDLMATKLKNAGTFNGPMARTNYNPVERYRNG